MEVFRISVPKRMDESMDECVARAISKCRAMAQDSVRVTGWPKCCRCKLNIELVVGLVRIPYRGPYQGRGAAAAGRWQTTCPHCGEVNR